MICSYEFANSQHLTLTRHWDLVVCDEAHRLRAYWTGQAKIAANVARICRASSKTVMLTATPLQNRLEELYGLVSVFDPDYFRSLDAFKERYVKTQVVWVMMIWLSESLRSLSARYGEMRISTFVSPPACR